MSLEAVEFVLLDEDLAVEDETLFVGANSTPDGDGPLVTLIPDGGLKPRGTHDAPLKYRRAWTQVVVRAKDPVVAKAHCELCFAACSMSNANIGSLGWFLFMRPASEIVELGVDGRQRTRFAFTVATERRA